MCMAKLTRSAPTLVLLAALAGCGSEAGGSATDPPGPDELAEHSGQPCPEELPEEEQGEGWEQPAESAPDLPAADEAWVCVYGDAGAPADGSRGYYVWKRSGQPVALSADELEAAQELLDELEPAPAEQACTADLGPRYVLVLSTGGDLTGVVLDDFGCHSARLTGDPHDIGPGDGSMAGLLTAPAELLDLLTRTAS